jgi:hypothetical protein
MANKKISAAHKAAMTRAKNRKDTSPAKASLAGPRNEQQNISIKKIDNGYLVTRGEYSRGGRYTERQTYTPKPPQIQIANAPKPKG